MYLLSKANRSDSSILKKANLIQQRGETRPGRGIKKKKRGDFPIVACEMDPRRGVCLTRDILRLWFWFLP